MIVDGFLFDVMVDLIKEYEIICFECGLVNFIEIC